MLVLSRKKNQSIQIGNIVITVNQINGNRVALGIKAPAEVRILRGELAHPEKKEAFGRSSRVVNFQLSGNLVPTISDELSAQ